MQVVNLHILQGTVPTKPAPVLVFFQHLPSNLAPDAGLVTLGIPKTPVDNARPEFQSHSCFDLVLLLLRHNLVLELLIGLLRNDFLLCQFILLLVGTVPSLIFDLPATVG